MFPELGERVIETGNDKKVLSQQVLSQHQSSYTSRYYGSREHGRYVSLRNQ
jgi:hypothetical protein